MSDPEIESTDVSMYSGMEYYAADSESRLVPWFRRSAAEAISNAEMLDCLRWAEAHTVLARRYRLADRVMAEVMAALAEEER